MKIWDLCDGASSDCSGKIQIAIDLFERHFEESQIEAALEHCSTLESAVEWLKTPMSKQSSGLEPEFVDDLKIDRKRLSKKTADVKSCGFSDQLHEHGSVSSGLAPEFRDDSNVDRKRLTKKTADAKSCASYSMDEQACASSPAKSCASNSMDERACASSPAPKSLSVEPSVVDEGLANTSSTAARDFPCELIDDTSRDKLQSRHVPRLSIPSCQHRPICPMEASQAVAWWTRAASQWQLIEQELQSKTTQRLKRMPPDFLVCTKRRCTGRSLSDATSNSDCSSASLDVGVHEDSDEIHQEQTIGGEHVDTHTMKYSTSVETCGICFDDIEQGQAVCLDCRHGWYCTSCIVRHADARLEMGAAHVACPECMVPIAEYSLRRLLPDTFIERLLTRSLEQAVSSTPGLWACPTPNCSMRVSLEDGEEARLNCMVCKKESCLRCGAQPYHADQTCEEYASRKQRRGRKKAAKKAEESFMKWMQRTGSKQCPTCGMAVTKQNLDMQNTQYQECHKMMCRNCNTKFCFKCMSVMTDTYSCGCSIAAHGFVNPFSGKREDHIPAPVLD